MDYTTILHKCQDNFFIDIYFFLWYRWFCQWGGMPFDEEKNYSVFDVNEFYILIWGFVGLIHKKINKKSAGPRQRKRRIMNKKELYPKEWVVDEVQSLKPKRNENGCWLYKDVLQYMVRVMEQDSPLFSLVLGLASFATANKLTDRQREKADEIIKYYEERGFFND